MDNSLNNIALGADIGKTKVAVGVCDVFSKKILKKYYCLLPQTDKATITASLYTAVENALKDYSHINGIGVGSFGLIDRENGTIFSSDSVPDWKNIPLAGILKEKYGFKTAVIENDAVAAAVGEYYFAATPQDTVAITVGTSIGFGVIIDGKIFRGGHNLCGQIAHLNITSPHFTLGELAGGKGIENRFLAKTGKKFSAKEVFAAAKSGELSEYGGAAKKITDEAASALANAVLLVQSVYHPDKVYLGGGVMSNDYFYGLVMDTFLKQSETAKFKNFHKIQLERAALGENSGICGGAVLCKNLIE